MCECVALSPGEAHCEGSGPLQNQRLCMAGLMEGPHQLHTEEEEEGDEGERYKKKYEEEGRFGRDGGRRRKKSLRTGRRGGEGKCFMKKVWRRRDCKCWMEGGKKDEEFCTDGC